MNYIYKILLKTTVLVLVSLYALVPVDIHAQIPMHEQVRAGAPQVMDIAPNGVYLEDSCIKLPSNFGYRSSDETTSGSVSLLQDFLISRGHLNSESTGYFGGMTLKAVKAYQLSKGLGGTGYVGNYTRGVIKVDTCGNTAQPVLDSVSTNNEINASNAVLMVKNISVIIQDEKGRPSYNSYLKCGNSATRDILQYSPNQDGKILFSTEECLKKGPTLWVSCPVGQVSNFPTRSVADFRGQIVITCAPAGYVANASAAVTQAQASAAASSLCPDGTPRQLVVVGRSSGCEGHEGSTSGTQNAPMINQFSLDRSSISSDQSATLSYSFWAPGLENERAMMCNILTYNNATGETGAGNSLYSGSFTGTRTFVGRDYPSGAKISVECRNPAGKVSRSVDLKFVASVPQESVGTPTPMSFTINGKNLTGNNMLTGFREVVQLSDSTATVTWGSTNATACTFNGENIGTSGTRTLSGLTSSIHSYRCTNSSGASSVIDFSITVPGTTATCNDALVIKTGAMCAPPAPTLSFSVNDINVTNLTSLVVPNPTATVSWGSKNAVSCTFNGENIGTSGTKTLSEIRSSSHKYVCTNSVGQSSTLSFSVVVSGGTSVNKANAPIISEFYLNPTTLRSNESATLTYHFWAPGVANEIPMACNISTYNIAKNETHAGNTLTYGSFRGTRTYAAQDFSSGAKISVECANPDGKVSKSIDLKVTTQDSTTPSASFAINGSPVTNGASVTLPSSTATVTWGSTNASTCLFNGENVGLSGTKTVSGLTSSSHAYVCTDSTGKSSRVDFSITVPGPAITWIDASTQCSRFAGVSSSFIISGPNPIPANYTVGTMSYQYDSSNLNNIRNINTSGCSAPVYVPPAITWIDATTQCSRFAGVASPLIISGPNPIPSNYTVGTMSYQYDSSNNSNIRNINTSGCSAPVAAAPAHAVTINFSPNPVIRNVTPLTISYSTNFVTSNCKVYLDGAYLTSIAGSSYSWAVGPQDRARTVVIECTTPEGGSVSSGSQTFTVTDVTTSTGAANSVLSTVGTSIQDAFTAVTGNIFEQGRGALSLLSGAASANAYAGTNVSKYCVNISSNLHRGNETPSVSKLQTFLVSKGLLSEKASGFFGDLTIEAVKAYQKSVGLPQTGMVYNATREAILTETCN